MRTWAQEVLEGVERDRGAKEGARDGQAVLGQLADADRGDNRHRAVDVAIWRQVHLLRRKRCAKCSVSNHRSDMYACAACSAPRSGKAKQHLHKDVRATGHNCKIASSCVKRMVPLVTQRPHLVDADLERVRVELKHQRRDEATDQCAEHLAREQRLGRRQRVVARPEVLRNARQVVSHASRAARGSIELRTPPTAGSSRILPQQQVLTCLSLQKRTSRSMAGQAMGQAKVRTPA